MFYKCLFTVTLQVQTTTNDFKQVQTGSVYIKRKWSYNNCTLKVFLRAIKWGSKYRTLEVVTIQCTNFEWPYRSQTRHSGQVYRFYRTNCAFHRSRFQMVFDQLAAIVQILNGWASGYQIPFEIQTICTQPLLDHSKSRVSRISGLVCLVK